ncbi:hypothetical protein C8F04DRAFT_1228837 [Mycena alexandri]|uniref:DEK C-terminal domain-containing protein n=1 Tax=Mycena alexandri TaxID=1745969 RepID=A0AAD6X9C2_9AGAR|nr:hypothetical protein C8F04DRAFT_1228837 [Mycena alexandri]
MPKSKLITPERAARAAKNMVDDARRNGTLADLSLRKIRRALETQFSLPALALDAEEFKEAVKSAVESGSDDEMPEPEIEIPIKTKKRKPEAVLESPPKRKQRKSASSTQFKSSEMVPTSDIEEDPEVKAEDTFTALEKPPVAGPGGGSAKENDGISPKKAPKTKKAASSVLRPSPRPSTSSTPKADSDSELSVLDDEPPKRTKKSKTSKPTDKGDKPKTSRGKKTSELSKDEETIKRLKSLVLACGVRKVWAKVFKDADTPSQQIRMLKEILTGLGMSGRMSLEQAKGIKEKRELAQELEDVQAFAAAATRSKPKPSQENEEDDEEEEEEEELPVKRKPNARRSIMAFLQDQSDDD